MGTQKISFISEQTNSSSFNYRKEDPESFVLDMENFSIAADRNSTSNSRIKKSLSRKGSQREKKSNPNAIANEKDTTIVATSSPRAPLLGAGMPESPVMMVVGTSEPLSSHSQSQHQITITAGNGNVNTNTDSKYGFRRNSFRRSSPWIDPRRVLYFFATLSSMGSIILIYFTLSMQKLTQGDTANLDLSH